MAGAVEGGEFVGQKAEQLRGLLKYDQRLLFTNLLKI